MQTTPKESVLTGQKPKGMMTPFVTTDGTRVQIMTDNSSTEPTQAPTSEPSPYIPTRKNAPTVIGEVKHRRGRPAWKSTSPIEKRRMGKDFSTWGPSWNNYPHTYQVVITSSRDNEVALEFEFTTKNMYRLFKETAYRLHILKRRGAYDQLNLTFTRLARPTNTVVEKVLVTEAEPVEGHMPRITEHQALDKELEL